MSLNTRERAATRDELHANLALTLLSPATIAAELGISEQRVVAALAVAGSRPEDIWLVRDYLDYSIRAGGATPHPYSSLSEDMRAAAQTWFPLVDVQTIIDERSI
ncbi:DUF2316 family protein [Rhodococcus sp. G-MC3]|uniref:DUF2316 family protein n=1 Tax=Rhodococcus sp. G-MC3 TaxID=3046209 RepID=UPI0024BB0B59|nr:DUF2316 family protein [Rhodococcus sp. G-MC3]MDJ0396442.1 DUF2316 family protein [Rhodococcus sp. G-MC3]